jgi:GrpB-like predicted nucleotidyltransferase (UPF0157 family)
VDYERKDLASATRLTLIIGRGTRRLSANASPQAYAKSVDGIAAQLDREKRIWSRTRPPSDQARSHRAAVVLIGEYAHAFRGFGRAVRAGNPAAVKRYDAERRSAERRYDRRTGTVSRSLERSHFVREMDRLRRLDAEISRRYAKL